MKIILVSIQIIFYFFAFYSFTGCLRSAQFLGSLITVKRVIGKWRVFSNKREVTFGGIDYKWHFAFSGKSIKYDSSSIYHLSSDSGLYPSFFQARFTLIKDSLLLIMYSCSSRDSLGITKITKSHLNITHTHIS